MGYLDNTGLKRFTAWVKSRLSHYLGKTGGEVDGDFTLSAHNGASEFNLYPDGVTLSASAVGSESEAKSALSLNPDHIAIEIANYYGGVSGVLIDSEGISIGGDPVVTEQSLNPAVDEKLAPVQDELANIQSELLNKVTQDEFASAMEYVDGRIPFEGIHQPVGAKLNMSNIGAINEQYVYEYQIGNFGVGMAYFEVDEIFSSSLSGSVQFNNIYGSGNPSTNIMEGIAILYMSGYTSYSRLWGMDGDTAFGFSFFVPDSMVGSSVGIYILALGNYK